VRTCLIACLLALFLALASAVRADDRIAIFDAHLHYNWEPKPFLPLADVLALFKRNKVTGILATSRPNDGTQALVGAAAPGLWVVPFIRPYRVRADIASWFKDPAIHDLIREEHKRGYYRGIGEFHLSGRAAATEWVRKAVDFSAEHRLFLHAHADVEALEILYAHNPKARIVWAHTGFSLEPARVQTLLERYPGLWGELSYRGGITDGTGAITPEWRLLFERFPDRFLIGSDTWIDARWAGYDQIMATYRAWLGQLPRAVAERIAHGNAERIFARPGVPVR
jgi:hypothetical protein